MLVDEALSVCERSKEINSFLAAFVLVYDRWVEADMQKKHRKAAK